MTNATATRFQAVAVNNQSWEPDGTFCVIANCGHWHRSYEAADRCLDRLRDYTCTHGVQTGKTCHHCQGSAHADNHSALWHTAEIRQR